ncbi:hypothetical protein CEXT_469301 [Caerostris extrusa]|uniref:Uncharacterized protein n=1 Tax=Caerostris extrusa TaxID=172846 RepID=A0AAV4NI67_CAEEX|nr:hypothetical protein CEXT_469301 [Caerostris extrusa]
MHVNKGVEKCVTLGGNNCAKNHTDHKRTTRSSALRYLVRLPLLILLESCEPPSDKRYLSQERLTKWSNMPPPRVLCPAQELYWGALEERIKGMSYCGDSQFIDLLQDRWVMLWICCVIRWVQ